jgi:hypothetical protein
MTDQDLTHSRIALNQSTFRDANQHIGVAAAEMELDGNLPFICECPDRVCTDIVRLPRAKYEEIRQDPRRFFTAAGHEDLSVRAGAGVVIEEHDGYRVVEKVGVAGELAADLYKGTPHG